MACQPRHSKDAYNNKTNANERSKSKASITMSYIKYTIGCRLVYCNISSRFFVA